MLHGINSAYPRSLPSESLAAAMSAKSSNPAMMITGMVPVVAIGTVSTNVSTSLQERGLWYAARSRRQPVIGSRLNSQ